MRVTQRALQWLHDRLSEGMRFVDPNPVREGLRVCLLGPDLGVRRWALNCIAIIGVAGDYELILDQIAIGEDDPDLMASVVKAIYAQARADAPRLLATRGVKVEGAYLIAAAEHSLEERERLVRTKIPIDTASTEELKAGLVLAGTSNAPEHLFFATHKNKVALEQLNLHPVPSVSKYSIWALAKLKLGFGALKIPLSEFDSSPPEVRKWVLRLLFTDPKSLRLNLEMVQRASCDTSEEVRHESAIELRDVYVEGLSTFITEWFFQEPFGPAREALMEHMAANGERSAEYWEIVTNLYEREPFSSHQRTRLEAAAAGSSLYGTLRIISAKGEIPMLLPENELFGSRSVTKVIQHFPNAQIGAVSGSGDIRAQTISAIRGVQSEEVRTLLERVLATVALLPQEHQRLEGTAIVAEVAKEPGKTTYQKLLGFLGGAKKGIDATSGLASGIDGLIGNISDLANIG